MEAALTALLNGTAALTALTGTRFYWLRIPDSVSTYPAIVLTVVSFDETYRADGASNLRRYVVQLDIYAETIADVVDVYDQVEIALSGYGPTGALHQIVIESVTDSNERREDREYLFRRRVDLGIWHER